MSKTFWLIHIWLLKILEIVLFKFGKIFKIIVDITSDWQHIAMYHLETWCNNVAHKRTNLLVISTSIIYHQQTDDSDEKEAGIVLI